MEKILVIEDSTVSQAQISDILSPEYALVFRKDGPSGVLAATDDLPDLILLDIHLPGMDGYEVCRILKGYEKTCTIPVLFITSMDSEKERMKGFDAGAEDYIIKPFYPEELLARVRVHLSSRRAKAQELEIERLKLLHEMAATVTREISTPITSAYASLFLLEKELTDPGEDISYNLANIKAKLDDIHETVQRLSQQPNSQ